MWAKDKIWSTVYDECCINIWFLFHFISAWSPSRYSSYPSSQDFILILSHGAHVNSFIFISLLNKTVIFLIKFWNETNEDDNERIAEQRSYHHQVREKSEPYNENIKINLKMMPMHCESRLFIKEGNVWKRMKPCWATLHLLALLSLHPMTLSSGLRRVPMKDDNVFIRITFDVNMWLWVYSYDSVHHQDNDWKVEQLLTLEPDVFSSLLSSIGSGITFLSFGIFSY